MAEKKEKTTLDKIEKLIVDGQKDVIEQLGKRIDGVKQGLGDRIDGVEGKLDKVEVKIDKIETSLRKEIKDAYDFLSHDIGRLEKGLLNEVKSKLDEHVKILHSV
ncbi:MAG: hypothetical protein KKA31_00795 [Candidatus Margulisbacteria bacterium]|nr:hypothetical protein [Candidatus Margulisiibacteriota bacterium]